VAVAIRISIHHDHAKATFVKGKFIPAGQTEAEDAILTFQASYVFHAPRSPQDFHTQCQGAK
jgi:hypothetical protein